MDAYWRAANYLSVGQIYLYDNPPLQKPLGKEHATVSIMSHYRDIPAVKHWNAPLIQPGTDYPML